MQAQPIHAIERAMVERLRVGLGRLVLSVDSYGGEFDEDLTTVVRRFPAAWVTFAGVLTTRPVSTSRRQYRANARFVVLVGQRSIRSERASRVGEPAGQVGSYDLVRAVRRLLTHQDFDLDGVDPLQPGAVRTLFNGQVRSDGASVFACEFDTAWIEAALEPGRWPAPDPAQIGQPNPSDPDVIFAEHAGRLDVPHPDLAHVRLDHRLPGTRGDEPADATDIVNLNKESP